MQGGALLLRGLPRELAEGGRTRARVPVACPRAVLPLNVTPTAHACLACLVTHKLTLKSTALNLSNATLALGAGMDAAVTFVPAMFVGMGLYRFTLGRNVEPAGPAPREAGVDA